MSCAAGSAQVGAGWAEVGRRLRGGWAEQTQDGWKLPCYHVIDTLREPTNIGAARNMRCWVFIGLRVSGRCWRSDERPRGNTPPLPPFVSHDRFLYWSTVRGLVLWVRVLLPCWRIGVREVWLLRIINASPLSPVSSVSRSRFFFRFLALAASCAPLAFVGGARPVLASCSTICPSSSSGPALSRASAVVVVVASVVASAVRLVAAAVARLPRSACPRDVLYQCHGDPSSSMVPLGSPSAPNAPVVAHRLLPPLLLLVLPLPSTSWSHSPLAQLAPPAASQPFAVRRPLVARRSSLATTAAALLALPRTRLRCVPRCPRRPALRFPAVPPPRPPCRSPPSLRQPVSPHAPCVHTAPRLG